jgi:hypothetical protein
MTRNKKFTRIATGITAGALLTVGAATIATSANAAPRADQNTTTSSTSSSTSTGAPKGKGMGNDMDRGMGRRHGMPGGPGMHHGVDRGTPVHGEMVVKNSDGTYSTHVDVNGTATAVSASSITVKAEDGFTATFVINSNTAVRTSATGGAITDVKVGDTVHVDGTKSGSTVTANDVHAGGPVGPKAKPAA